MKIKKGFRPSKIKQVSTGDPASTFDPSAGHANIKGKKSLGKKRYNGIVAPAYDVENPTKEVVIGRITQDGAYEPEGLPSGTPVAAVKPISEVTHQPDEQQDFNPIHDPIIDDVPAVQSPGRPVMTTAITDGMASGGTGATVGGNIVTEQKPTEDTAQPANKMSSTTKMLFGIVGLVLIVVLFKFFK